MSDNEYICEWCGKSFKRPQNLEGHVRFKHPEHIDEFLQKTSENKEKNLSDSIKPTPTTKNKPKGDSSSTTGDYKVTTTQGVQLAGKELAAVEALVKAGFGKNLGEVMRNALVLSTLVHAQRLNLGGGVIKMGNESDNPKTDAMEEMEAALDKEQRRKAAQAMIDRMKSEGKSDDGIVKDLENQVRIRNYQKILGGEGDLKELMKDMMVMQMMQNMMSGQKGAPNDGGDKRFEMMQKEIEKIEKLFERTLEDRKHDELKEQLKELKEQQVQPVDSLLKLQTTMSEREIKHREDMSTKERELLSATLSAKMDRLQDQLASAQSGKRMDIKEVSDTVTAIKDLSEKLGMDKRGEKSGAEIATDLISGVVDKIREPILQPLGSAMADKIRQERLNEQAAQVATPQLPPTPKKAAAPPTEESYSDLVNPM